MKKGANNLKKRKTQNDAEIGLKTKAPGSVSTESDSMENWLGETQAETSIVVEERVIPVNTNRVKIIEDTPDEDVKKPTNVDKKPAFPDLANLKIYNKKTLAETEAILEGIYKRMFASDPDWVEF